MKLADPTSFDRVRPGTGTAACLLAAVLALACAPESTATGDANDDADGLVEVDGHTLDTDGLDVVEETSVGQGDTGAGGSSEDAMFTSDGEADSDECSPPGVVFGGTRMEEAWDAVDEVEENVKFGIVLQNLSDGAGGLIESIELTGPGTMSLSVSMCSLDFEILENQGPTPIGCAFGASESFSYEYVFHCTGGNPPCGGTHLIQLVFRSTCGATKTLPMTLKVGKGP